MKKILFIHPYAPPRHESVAKHIESVSKHLKYDISWLSFEKVISPVNNITQVNIPCIEFDIPGITPPPVKSVFLKSKECIKSLENTDFDIINLQFTYFYDLNILANKIAKSKDSRFTVAIHHPLKILPYKGINSIINFFYKKILKDSINLSDGMCFASSYTKGTFFDIFNYNKNFDVCYTGVDENKFYPSGKHNKFSSLSPYILYVGRMTNLKNQKHLIHALNLLENKGIKLVLVGARTSYRDMLEDLCKRLNLADRVIFFENLVQKDLIDLIRACSVYASTSLSEGFGINIAEAMACEKLCIAYGVDSIPEVMGDFGIAVPSNDISSLAKEIDYYIENEKDARKIGSGARIRIKNNFTWKIIAKRYEKHFKSL